MSIWKDVLGLHEIITFSVRDLSTCRLLHPLEILESMSIISGNGSMSPIIEPGAKDLSIALRIDCKEPGDIVGSEFSLLFLRPSSTTSIDKLLNAPRVSFSCVKE